jgi:hypothetical protein
MTGPVALLPFEDGQNKRSNQRPSAIRPELQPRRAFQGVFSKIETDGASGLICLGPTPPVEKHSLGY